ncbi:Negative elongation factor B [Smittium culicis]|uniref:Negative elongation factor B n=1 Tax=Smittium culicis TaxID=133412 RepID=A0A1R1YEQ3_9FUNG|nr:Negative elongation factor B [Smittium culicis]
MSNSADFNSMNKNGSIRSVGQDQIKKNFNSGNVHEAVDSFFSENRLQTEFSDSLYWIIDLLRISRSKFHVKVLQHLTKEIISDIKQAARDANDNSGLLGNQYFSSNYSPLASKVNIKDFIYKLENYIDIHEVVVLMIELLEQVEDMPLPQSLIHILKTDFPLYKRCGISLKRRIWHQDHEILITDVDQILNSYCADVNLSTLNKEMSKQNMYHATKIRREHPDLYHIFEIVNGDVSLYNAVTDVVEKKFKATYRIELCTFRLDFLMIMHNHDVRKVVENDPVYGLAWSLDSGIIKQVIEPKRIREIERSMDSCTSNVSVIKTFAMICTSPFSRHLFSRSCIELIYSLKYSDSIKSNSELAWLIQMISLSSNFLFVVSPEITEIPNLLNERDLAAIHQLCIEIYELKKGAIGVTDFSHLNLIEYSEVARQLVYKIVLDFIENGEFGIVDAMLPLLWRATCRLYERLDDEYSADPKHTMAKSDDADGFNDDRSNLHFDISGILPDPTSISSFINYKNRVPWQQPQVKSTYNNSEVCFFELESFVQSLITTITSTKSLTTKLLNSGAMSNRLFMFMEKYARVNTFGHIQFLRLIEKISLTLSAAMNDAFSSSGTISSQRNPSSDRGIYGSKISKTASHNNGFGKINLNKDNKQENNWNSPDSFSSGVTGNNGVNNHLSPVSHFGILGDSPFSVDDTSNVDDGMPIIDMLGAANLAFRYSERLAAYGSVDIYSYNELVNAYNKVISSSPANAFNFRVSKLNCPQINNFFNISFE